jgi:hypothetical protein
VDDEARARVTGYAPATLEDGTPVPFTVIAAAITVIAEALCDCEFVRHEALLNRAVMKGHRLRPVAAGREKLRAARSLG